MCSVASLSIAADWSAKTSLSETVEASDNFFLNTAPKGNLYSSVSALFFEAAARTPTSRYFINGDFAYIHYTGPGAADTPLTNITQNGVSLNAEYFGHTPGDKLNLTTSWRRQDITAAQLNDIGVATTAGEMSTILGSASYTKQVDAINSLVFGATASSVNFTGGGAQPYRNLTVGPTWTHLLNPNFDLVSLADLSWTVRDDASNSETKLTRLMTGFRLRPIPGLRITASAGAGIVSSTGDNAAANVFGTSTSGFGTSQPGNSGAVVGWLADALVAYKLWSNTDLTLTASRSVSPGVLGDLSLRMNYAVLLSHAVNATSSVSLRGELTQTTTFGTSFDFWTASASYERRLTREWRSNVSYTYRKRISDTQTVSSNAVTFVLARDVTLLP